MKSLREYLINLITRSSNPRVRQSAEEGETLIELLIALVIIGITAVALLLTFSTSIMASSEYRNLASSDTVLRSALEEATSQIQQLQTNVWALPSCGITNANVGTLNTPPGSGYTATISSVQYWNSASSSFSATCSPNSAVLISVQTTNTATGATQSISSVVNDPWKSNPAPFGVAAQLVFLQQPTTTTAGSTFSVSPEIAIEDNGGIIVTSDLSGMTLKITPNTGSSGATLSNCSGSEFAGVVTFTGCSIGSVGTGYTLTATDALLPPASTRNAFNITAGSPARLAFASQVAGGNSGTVWLSSTTVAVEDNASNLVPTATNQVQLSITAQPTNGATLSCTANPVNASGGTATFAGCEISGAAGSYTLTAYSTGLNQASASFTLTVIGSPAKLAFTNQTGSGSSGTVWLSSTTVAVEDNASNLVPTATNQVQLSITAQPTNGATLSCTANPVNASGGTATFAGCEISGAAGSYTLTASSTGLNQASASFTLSAGGAKALAFTTLPVGSTSGNVWIPQPTVSIEDSGGNVVTTATNKVTLAITSQPSSGATLLCDTNPVSASGGAATFAGCEISGDTGSYTITATTSGLTSGSTTVNVSAPSNYAGSSSGNISNGTHYYSINTQNSAGKSNDKQNTLTPGVAETLRGPTFEINTSSGSDYTATIGIVTNYSWTATALTCTIHGGSGSTCTVPANVTISSTQSINIAVTGNGSRSGAWTTTYTQP